MVLGDGSEPDDRRGYWSIANKQGYRLTSGLSSHDSNGSSMSRTREAAEYVRAS